MTDNDWLILRESARESISDWATSSQIMVNGVNHCTEIMMESSSWKEFEQKIDTYVKFIQEPVRTEIKSLVVTFLFGVTLQVEESDNAKGNTGQ